MSKSYQLTVRANTEEIPSRIRHLADSLPMLPSERQGFSRGLCTDIDTERRH